MYAPYFGLRHEPFSIAPDPRYLFMSDRHREALAHLVYGLSSGGGFVLLTGEIGTGKTTVCRAFLEQVPAHCRVAYIFNPRLTVAELLQTICQEFQVPTPAPAPGDGVKAYVDALNAFLLQEHAAGRQCVLIIDEAQNLAPDVLEQLRLLTNLETSERKLLQIILIGQPELRDMVASPQLEQLAQRVIARYHLLPLSERETVQYVRHRLEVAGLERVPPFEPRAIRRIHRLARGNPRRINLLCDRALLGAFARSRAGVSPALVDQAAGEVFDDRARVPRAGRRKAVFAAAGMALVAGIIAAGALAYGWTVPGTGWIHSGLRPDGAASGAHQARGPAGRANVPPQPATDLPPRLMASQEEAWRELAAGWGAQVPASGAVCPQLARQGLQCFRGTLTLPLIREMDRPGIVTLDPDASPSYAVLVRLSGDSVTLRAQGTEQTVTLEALGRRWKGDWATLWRAPEGYTGRSADGWRSPLVDWAAAQLPGAPDPASAADVQAGLRERLRSFQVAQGLAPTGTFTPLTYMQLNRVARVDEPRLRERR
jgi:general secretion pathway protein A